MKVSHELFAPVVELAQIIEQRLRSGWELTPKLFDYDFTISANPRLEAIARRVLEGLSKCEKRQLPVSPVEVLEQLNTYDLISRDFEKPLVTLAEIFYAYVNARVTLSLRGLSVHEIEARLGEAPWNEANRLLQLFEVEYRLTNPEDLRFTYELQCYFPESRVTVPPSALSSGEQAVLALVAVVVTTAVLGVRRSRGEERPEEREGRNDDADEYSVDEDEAEAATDDKREDSASPRSRTTELLLLDEPDAHLHTSMVKRYLEHLEQLTQQGVQIIMVTHRPDTIALAPEGSLFEMRRDGGRTSITKVQSRSELIGRLAADTIAVLPGVRVVLVEDEDDRKFHQWAYGQACKLGCLGVFPQLVFMPVLAKDPKRPGGGGKTVVIARLAAFGQEGLGAVFRGLIDGDNETTPLPPGVVRLERYTLESYLADPIALYCAVVSSSDFDEQLQLSKQGGIGRGDFEELRKAGSDKLQQIADLVLSKLEEEALLRDRTRQRVKLYGASTEVALEYPRWIFSATKTELRAALSKLHAGIFERNCLNSGPEWSKLLPEDLIAAYRRLAMDLR